MSSHSSAPELSQVVAWLGLEFCVPEAWEIVRHATAFERGSLVLVDRVRQRLSVSWTGCPRSPDLERLFADFEDQPLGAGEAVLARREVFGWRVLERGKPGGERVAHALRFDPLSHRLIELELPGLVGSPGEVLTQRLLAGFSLSAREPLVVRAFGLHAVLPAGFTLSASQVKPADVSLLFERAAISGGRSAARLSIRRSGMARAWFDGNAARAIASRAAEVRYREFVDAAIGPHVATVAKGRSRGAFVRRAFGQLVERQATLWECPEQNAVFETELCLSSGDDASEIVPSVWCCAEHAPETHHGA